MLRIGITQRVVARPDRGERWDALDQSWTCLLARLGAFAVPLANRVENPDSLIDALGLHGVILSGGNDLACLPNPENPAPERDMFERNLIAVCADRTLPLLGVCRGMQMILATGGMLPVQVSGHVGSSHPITPAENCPLPLASRAVVNSFHNYGFYVQSIKGDFSAAALAEDGTVEAVYHRQLPIWGVMWHPEKGPTDEDDDVLIRALFGL